MKEDRRLVKACEMSHPQDREECLRLDKTRHD